MTRRTANVLLVAAAWTFFVWGVAIKNLVIDDHTLAFRVVHFVLAAISLAFGAYVGRLGWKARSIVNRDRLVS